MKKKWLKLSTHSKSVKDLKLIMEAFADSIDHQEVSRLVRCLAVAGPCIDRQGGAFRDALQAMIHVEIVHVMCKTGCCEQDQSVMCLWHVLLLCRFVHELRLLQRLIVLRKNMRLRNGLPCLHGYWTYVSVAQYQEIELIYQNVSMCCMLSQLFIILSQLFLCCNEFSKK